MQSRCTTKLQPEVSRGQTSRPLQRSCSFPNELTPAFHLFLPTITHTIPPNTQLKSQLDPNNLCLPGGKSWNKDVWFDCKLRTFLSYKGKHGRVKGQESVYKSESSCHPWSCLVLTPCPISFQWALGSISFGQCLDDFTYGTLCAKSWHLKRNWLRLSHAAQF